MYQKSWYNLMHAQSVCTSLSFHSHPSPFGEPGFEANVNTVHVDMVHVDTVHVDTVPVHADTVHVNPVHVNTVHVDTTQYI